jgi:hypothetical protein
MMPYWRSMKLFPSTRHFLLHLTATLAIGVALLATSLASADASNTTVSASTDKRYEGLLAPQEPWAVPRKARMQTADRPQSSRPKHPGGSKEKAREVAERIHAFDYAPEPAQTDRPIHRPSHACAWAWLSRAPPALFS